jgi:hypothetical protein
VLLVPATCWHRGPVPTPSETTFEVVDRADGSVLGTYPVAGEPEVRAVVAAAHDAAPGWAAASVGERCRTLRAWRGELWRSSSALADLLQREVGLSVDEAMREVLRTVEHLRWLEGRAARVLAPASSGAGPLSPELGTTTSWLPEGVVAVVATGRPSLYAAASAVACALVGGNVVVLQPGGRQTATLTAYAEAFGRAHRHAPRGLLQVLTGDDATATALAASPVDRVCFLGSPVAGVRVATAAARAMVPVTVVPVVPPVTLVAPDADLEQAAAAVARLGEGRDDEPPHVFVAPSALAGFQEALDRVAAPDEPRRGVLGRARVRRRAPAELTGPRAGVRLESAPAFDVLVERLRAHATVEVAIHSARHGTRLAELLTAAEVTVNAPGAARGADGGVPRASLGSRGWGPFAGDAGVRAFTRARTTTARRRLPVPTAPVELLLATPPGRVATRLALHLRHSLD